MFGMIVNDNNEITEFVGLAENDNSVEDRYKFKLEALPADFFSDFEPTKFLIDDHGVVVANSNFDPASLPRGPIAEIDKPKVDHNRDAISSVVLQVAKMQVSNQKLAKQVTDVDSKITTTENVIKNDPTKAAVAQLTMQLADLQMTNQALTAKVDGLTKELNNLKEGSN